MHINIGNHFPTSPLCLLLHLHTIFPLHLSSPLSFSGDASSKTHFYHFRLLPSSIIFFSGSGSIPVNRVFQATIFVEEVLELNRCGRQSESAVLDILLANGPLNSLTDLSSSQHILAIGSLCQICTFKAELLSNSFGNVLTSSYDEKVACKKIIEKKALKGFQDLKLQALLVHHIMLREVYSMSEDVDFWFKINGTMVRFSIEEFSLITELKCHGNDDKSIFVEKDES
ncbi:hypothetical protein F8388_023141 [Cannabis sativa]|uniref:Uncharacterized protein n=1 Tax=Cannabis sativa TaxID=3483 RepID=A0A7J6HDA3_CANSA|nr:hypothetical protein F8388_023141 [Cannabis sativa]